MIGHALSVLLLTEDSGGDALAVLQALSEKMFRLIEPQLNMARVGFDPALDNQKAHVAMNANGWKDSGPKGHRKRIDLGQAIATKLIREDGLVLFHVDGDCRWAESQAGTRGDNLDAFKEHLLPRIKLLLEQRNQSERLGRLVMVVPFWCMEAWLYQNVDEALRIYAKHHPEARSEILLFEKWRAEPALLDEVKRPKDDATIRLKDKYNLRLAKQQFPAARAYDAGKSFKLVVDNLRRCPGLRPALQQLRCDWAT